MIITEVKWSSAIDELLRQKFKELTIEKLREEIFTKHGINVPELLILHRESFLMRKTSILILRLT